MNSKIVQMLMVMALVIPIATLAQTDSAAAATTPAPSTTTATAPALGAAKIGVISIQDAILATNEGQKDFEALGKKFEPKRNEIKSLNDEIESLKKQLDTQGSKMNDESRNSLVQQLQSKQKSLSRTQEDAQNDFVGQQNEIAQKILQKLGPVIDKYAKENGLSLIIDVSKPWPDGPVLWANQTVDITKPIVEIYNNQSGVPAAPSAARSGSTTRPAGVTTRPSTPATKPTTSAPPK
ncbi:MAG TPA: OmpH family outer membrane protein [Terriglobales bacterium]|nr:OmpH family outer membrane protein [Terriglobales bacterium]